ncbi:MAG: N-acetylmuramoyl-L-alanine amidase [Candidatus Improbicoccus devescovinae]|nr:MAG: N-acetylmuramoyl-L-alanine amidase [Candidatus Improbicoccus devescovinae]
MCFLLLSAVAKSVVIVIDPGHGGIENKGACTAISQDVVKLARKALQNTQSAKSLHSGHSVDKPGQFLQIQQYELIEELLVKLEETSMLDEADLNMVVAKIMQQILVNYIDPRNECVKVYLTHDGNSETSLTLDNRVEQAKNMNASILISIHFNSSNDHGRQGGFVIVPYVVCDLMYFGFSLPQFTQNGIIGYVCKKVATKIINEWRKVGLCINSDFGFHGEKVLCSDGKYMRLSTDGELYDDGHLTDYYRILKCGMKLGVPVILLEACYLSNFEDLLFLLCQNGIAKIALANVTAIADCFKLKYKPKVNSI